MGLLSDLPAIRRRFGPLRRWRTPSADFDASTSLAEEQPLRDEFFSVDQLDRHAKSLAGWHEVTDGARRRGRDLLLPRLTDNEHVLRDAYVLVTDAVKRGRRVTPAAEWFLDNFHLIEDQIRTARQHLPRGYSRELPQLKNGPSAGYPRVYAIALELIAHVDGRVDAESLRAFVTAYQSIAPLRLGELWAIPIMLRLALLENLRRVAVRVAEGRVDRERATFWIDRMLETATKAPADVVLVLAEMVRENPPLSVSFVAEFARRMQGQGAALSFPITWLEQRVAEQGLTVESIFQQASQSQAADQVSIGNSIGSLRFLGAMEWRDFVESLSAVERILRTDPASVYGAMDFTTRDRYRHCVEEIARHSPWTEETVAAQAIKEASENTAGTNGANGQHNAQVPNHVGFYLVGKGRPILEQKARVRFHLGKSIRRFCRRFPLTIYLSSILILTAVITAALANWAANRGIGHWGLAIWTILLFFSTSQLAVAISHWFAMLFIKPRLLPRMDFSLGIPKEHRTIVAVPTMIKDREEIDELLEALEVRFLANRDDNLYFALLTDFPDAEQEKMPDDDALVQHLQQEVENLNAKYALGPSKPPEGENRVASVEYDRTPAGGPFFVFQRPRKWNEQEGAWMGWERKRGKLENFNDALRGSDANFSLVVGPTDRLRAVKYVITLDTDTQLPRDSARELVGTMAHPLNRPHFDERLGRVTEGYAILQPRVGVSMPSANRSRFAQLFAGDPGIDPYTRAVSDVYQDVFQEGSFIGKGIYDVDTFQRAIGGKLPENHVLSHDLLESGYGRSGLVSDVQLFEDFPSSHSADVSRRTRWIRGDWQILPWLMLRVPGVGESHTHNPISQLSRWKILDNIRRSIIPSATLGLLLVGWLLEGGSLFSTLVVIAIAFLPALLSGATELLRKSSDMAFFYHARLTMRPVTRQALQQLFVLICLPYEAFISVDAIIRTVERLFISRRKMLEWRTARDAQRGAAGGLTGFYRAMWIQPAAAAILTLVLKYLRADALPVAGPFIALWFVAPGIAHWLSRPVVSGQAELSGEDLLFLSKVARRTWRFFETFVGSVDNDLPPDNFQEDPPQGPAHRTSPTNIGMSLLANLAAYDFGFITPADLIGRTSRTLATLDKMQRYRGHFYNWYDTRTLQPLPTLYVSTVDSGNMAGHMLILAAGLDELADQKIIRQADLNGLGTTLDVLFEIAADNAALPPLKQMRDLLHAIPPSLPETHALVKKAVESINTFNAALGAETNGEIVWWSQAAQHQATALSADLDLLAPWAQTANPPTTTEPGPLHDALKQLSEIPTLGNLARIESTLLPAFDQAASENGSAKIRDAVVAGSEAAAKRLSEIRQLAIRYRELADIDYSFLYDKNRRLLSIGYNVTDHRLDPGYYDLLASESRLGSFIAIAEGKLPVEHWFSLGRSLTGTGGGMALLSWSGSMFEYLMPVLVMPNYEHTLLDETCRSVVRRQIEYGKERGVPWGVSESGYTKTDAQGNYQYQAFGVPGLGFKRGLADDLVIAPYASIMALMIDPRASCDNLRRLEKDGRLNAYGYYEAIDYSPSRLPPGQSSVTVRSYMAHHQGMAFLALAYAMLDRPMQRRFESDPMFRATDLLLQERAPKAAFIYPHPAEVSLEHKGSSDAGGDMRVFNNPATPVPEVHLLSNSRYHVAVTAAGGGYSRWRDQAITRWREDTTCDNWGTFCYVRDVDSGEFWSIADQPTHKRADFYEAVYSQGRVEFRRRDGDLESHLEISVSPEDDVEMRRISITNRGAEPRTIELTSYAEVVIAPPAADIAHPAFSNLFVQTEIIRDRQAILCTRRPRSPGETPPWMIHLMAVYDNSTSNTSYESSREQFIGRARSAADPEAMHRRSLGNSEGSVLDPIVSVRNTITVGPDQTVRVHLVTGAADTRAGAMSLIEKYHDRRSADRVFELAWTHSQVVLRQLDASESDAQLFGRLASNILYANPLLRAAGSVIARNVRGQSGLWAYGISGDLPIVLLRIGDQSQIGLVRQLVQAHAYWRMHGLAVDLVIWNEDQSGYRQTMQDQITAVITSRSEASLMDKKGGIFIRRLEQIADEDKVLMQTVARAIINGTSGTLAEQVDRRPALELQMPRFRPTRGRRGDYPTAVEMPAHDLACYNGLGGFTRDGREYVITTSADSPTPAPWVNVLANPWFGTLISESGGSYTWCENAYSNRLTPWNNDAVTDVSGEAFYLRDEDSGKFWSPTPLPTRGAMPYTIRHGFGYSVFEYAEDGISTQMQVYVATVAPVKFVVFKVRNISGRARRISLTGYFELLLGDRREIHAPHIVTELDLKTGALFAHNPYNSEFADRVAFLDCTEFKRTITGDRTEFLGRNGTMAEPLCMTRVRLSGKLGAGLDPCAAMQVTIELAEGQERDVAFTFGSGRDLADARTLVNRYHGLGPARNALEGVWKFWNETLGAVHIETPDETVNFLANGWLLYQVLASRIWGRTGFYQSGGAFGFRDQLQDTMSLVHAQPTILRGQILRCAGRQFKEGDVQHWWHLPAGRGVRTRISDDYLWLPFATCRYVAALGDTGVLDEKVQFLEGRPVQPTEDSYYDLPTISDESGTLYEHCVRSIKNGLKFGSHGLPLMGCGDWNDGMNLVGEHGKGESVWLAFFLYDVLMQFSEIAKYRKDEAIVTLCATEAEKLRKNIEENGWDGAWYRRAYFDDGSPLGSSSNPECKIDSIPQSWSVLSAGGPPERSTQAMDAVDHQLVKRDIGLIQLFDPPFDKSALEPGYVKGYVPGVRENGGQYTHAAIWSVMAFAHMGDSKRAWELFQLINPIRHSDTEVAMRKYKVEPYVVAADVYANPQHAGRGGWTWYTGSAGWMYRLITESLLGLNLEIDKLRFSPCLPPDWPEFKIHYRYRETFFHITVTNGGTGKKVKKIVTDGAESSDSRVQLIDDRKEHYVDVEME